MGADQRLVSDPYAELVTLAERELELVSGGSTEDLEAIQRERDALVASLPDAPPESARGSLERAARLQSQVSEALTASLGALGGEIERLDRGRTAVRGYAPATEPRRVLDQTG
jgi:hypothetical protein